jgi:hypothetical protein
MSGLAAVVICLTYLKAHCVIYWHYRRASIRNLYEDDLNKQKRVFYPKLIVSLSINDNPKISGAGRAKRLPTILA